MHDHHLDTEQRLKRFRRERIDPAKYRAQQDLQVDAWVVPGEPVPFADAVAGAYTPIHEGENWGRPWGTVWLHVTGRVPAEWGDAAGVLPPELALEAVVDLGFDRSMPGFQAEGLAYGPDGNPIKTIAPRNCHLPLPQVAGTGVDFYLEAASNPTIAGSDWLCAPTPLGDLESAGSRPLYRLGPVRVALLDRQVWELARDIDVLSGLIGELPLSAPRRAVVLRALERMVDTMDPDDIAGTATAGRAALTSALASPAVASAHHVVAVGHAHIDSAWLWPVRETVRKCARTFSNVLSLMDENPDFVFACSSAQQFAWIKARYPELFERIRAKVRSGQFVPVGGMWVESDTNMPGGEAMARQFVEGKSFFIEEFDIDCEEVWLPDSFGYSAGLPQIAVAAGARWFLTQKISWNQTNRMPHHTFRWQGIDGTRIFTHFPPVDTYNSELSTAELAHAERNYADHGHGSVSLVPFGHGDGGGGPTREMIGRGRRFHSLEGSPTVQFGSPRAFFERAEQDYPEPPTWVGEMYLELHRGTYTSQMRTKQGNRRCEHLLREAELWAATAAVRVGADYPYDELQRLWRIVLLQQFHDILPGSSIAWVHREAERTYGEVRAALEVIIADALQALCGDGDRDICFNAGPFERNGVAGLAAGPLAVTPTAPDVRGVHTGSGFILDNGLLRVVVDRRGLISSLTDTVTGREVIPPGARANLLQVHRDIPNQWDAWDIDGHYRNTVTDLMEATSISLESTGPETAAIRVVHAFGNSLIEQVIALTRGSAAVDITLQIDWHERQKLLKLAFPIDVAADRSASETQFGHVFRATHSNTSWEAAKFEICAHRWIHVGEQGYGVAIANDSTYGHDVTQSPRVDGGTFTTVRLSLLRAPLFPDPDADQGAHVFRVSVVPGADIGSAIEAGYAINLPVRTVRGAREVPPIASVSTQGVVVEAVKLARDRSGDLVVRLYESLGRRTTVTVVAGFDATTVGVVDLLERPVAGSTTRAGGENVIELRPFELMTLRFSR